MVSVLLRCERDDRATLHEAGKEAAQRAVRIALAEKKSGEPSTLAIRKDERGKPYGMADGRIVAASLSHSFPFALGVASLLPHVLVGADVERVRSFPRQTWEAFLTRAEKKYIREASGEKELLRTLAWSLKESVLKALGTGLRLHPRHVDVSEVMARSLEGTVCGSIWIRKKRVQATCQSWMAAAGFVATAVTLPSSEFTDTVLFATL